MNFLIPFVSAILFRLGGVGRDDRFLPFMKPPTPIAAKVWRWLGIGCFIALIYHNWLVIGTYLIATWAFAYGEKSWLGKLFGRDASWAIYGFVFGLAAWPVMGCEALVQAVIGMIAFYLLMRWSNYGYQKDGYAKHFLDQAYVEIGIGFIGTFLYFFAK
jgi:hypothetical protein